MKKIFKFGSLLLGLSLLAGGLTVGGHKDIKEAKADDSGSVVVSIPYTDIPDGFTATTGTSGTFTKTVIADNDLTVGYGGINTKSKATDADHKYGYLMFLKNYGFIYSDNTITDYFVSEVSVTIGSGSGESGKAGISISAEKESTRIASVTGAVKKGATITAKNSNKAFGFWNFSTTGANVQIASISITYTSTKVSDTKLDSISVADISMNPAQKATVGVEFNPENATNQNLTYEITEGSDVATVDDKGVVTALKAGTATLKVTPEDTNAAPQTATITVENFSEVEVVEIGKKYIMVAGNYEFTGIESNNGTFAEYTGSPKGTLKLEVVAGAYENTVAFKMGDKYLEYHGSDNKIYTSDAVTAQSSWTVATEAEIGVVVRNVADRTRVLSCNTDTHKFNCYANLNQAMVSFVEYVEGVDLVSFAITETLDVKVGLTGTIAVTYNPANASDKTLTWASEDEEIATVVDGVVTGVAEGTTTITASKSGLTSQTCSVTVSKIAQHEGSESDPYTVADAVAVAKGGTEGMKTGKYIKGLVTKLISGSSAASCSFWVGDNLEQISAETGAFEAFKLANITADAFKLIKIGSTVIISGDITLYQSKTAETSEGGTLVYNSYAVANEFARTWNENMATICAETKSDPAGTAGNFDLYCEFSITESSYKLLAADVKVHFLGEGKTGSNATEVEKMIATYDYCMSKYTNLVNFLGRTPASSARQFTIADYNNNNTSVTIIAIVSVASVGCLIALIAIKRRKSMITK